MRFFLFFCFLSCSIWKMDAAVYGSDTLRCRICFPVGSSVVDLSYGRTVRAWMPLWRGFMPGKQQPCCAV